MNELTTLIMKIYTQSRTWLEQDFLSFGTFIEAIIILFALFVGFFARKLIAPPISSLLDQTSFHWRIKHVLRNIVKLTLHIVALFILFIAAEALRMETVPIKPYVILAVSKMLLAWVFIRIVAQFIQNNFIRNLIATSAWIIAVLSIVGFLDDTMNILDAIAFKFGDFKLSILSVFKSIVAVLFFVYGAIFISNVIERRIQKSADLSVSARVLLNKTIKFTLITLAILVGVSSAGIDLSILAVFGGALGLGIGFGLQKGVSNLFSGMLLLLDRSIKPGDVIELQQDGTFGWVEQMGARYTNIVTRDNKSFLVPNEDLITQQVVNWSHGDTLVRLEVDFGVHYDSDPHLIREIAVEAAKKPDRVQDEPSPVCFLMEFGDSSINFKLRFWIKDAQNGVTNIKGAVMLALWDILKENNVQIPYPHREVFIHNPQK